MVTMKCQVDHFIPVSILKKRGEDEQHTNGPTSATARACSTKESQAILFLTHLKSAITGFRFRFLILTAWFDCYGAGSQDES